MPAEPGPEEMLKKLEWVLRCDEANRHVVEPWYECPWCHNPSRLGHVEDCELRKVLDRHAS